ncbi:MAG: hypothetical protein ABNH15_05825 [Alcanivorax sp.]|jgi:hypothetical protein
MGITVRSKDRLSNYPGFKDRDYRRERMVWMKLFLKDFQGITFKPTTDMIRTEINNYIDLIEREAPRILVEEVVQNGAIDWITNDKRLLKWLLRNIPNEVSNREIELFGNSDSEKVHEELKFKSALNAMNVTEQERIIAFIDAISPETKDLRGRQYREILLENLQNGWKSHQQQTMFISRFLKEDTKEKLSLINACSLLNGPFDSEIEVKIALDALSFSDGPAAVKLLIGKLRNQFNSSTYRKKNKDAKQVNLYLSTELIKQIEKKAKEKGIKRNTLIVALLNEGLQNIK